MLDSSSPGFISFESFYFFNYRQGV